MFLFHVPQGPFTLINGTLGYTVYSAVWNDYESEGTINSSTILLVFIMFENYHARDVERSVHFINLRASSWLKTSEEQEMFFKWNWD